MLLFYLTAWLLFLITITYFKIKTAFFTLLTTTWKSAILDFAAEPQLLTRWSNITSVFYVNRVSWDSKGVVPAIYCITRHTFWRTHTQTHQASCHCLIPCWICPVKAWRTNPQLTSIALRTANTSLVPIGFDLERECNFRASYIYPSTVRLEGLRCTTACHECVRGQAHFMNAMESCKKHWFSNYVKRILHCGY